MSYGIMKVCHVYQLKRAHTHRCNMYMLVHAISFIYALRIFSRAGVEFIRKQDAALGEFALALCGQFN